MGSHQLVVLEGPKARSLWAHRKEDCVGGPCPIHKRSKHHMREWTQHWRMDSSFMERICPHGVGHPDPDCGNADPVHGCDGCCRPTEQKLTRNRDTEELSAWWDKVLEIARS